MKILRSLLVWAMLLAPMSMYAQPGQNEILFNTGVFSPKENLKNLSKKDALFTQSLFGGKHYVVIQFYSLPTVELKNKLQNLKIDLIDYLPRNAYTAIVPETVDINNLRSFNIRSIFVLNKDQKSSEAIQTNQIPDYASKQTGFADVSVILYPNISSTQLISATAEMNSKLLEDMPMFRTVTLRIKKEKLEDLINLPFLF